MKRFLLHFALLFFALFLIPQNAHAATTLTISPNPSTDVAPTKLTATCDKMEGDVLFTLRYNGGLLTTKRVEDIDNSNRSEEGVSISGNTITWQSTFAAESYSVTAECNRSVSAETPLKINETPKCTRAIHFLVNPDSAQPGTTNTIYSFAGEIENCSQKKTILHLTKSTSETELTFNVTTDAEGNFPDNGNAHQTTLGEGVWSVSMTDAFGTTIMLPRTYVITVKAGAQKLCGDLAIENDPLCPASCPSFLDSNSQLRCGGDSCKTPTVGSLPTCDPKSPKIEDTLTCNGGGGVMCANPAAIICKDAASVTKCAAPLPIFLDEELEDRCQHINEATLPNCQGGETMEDTVLRCGGDKKGYVCPSAASKLCKNPDGGGRIPKGKVVCVPRAPEVPNCTQATGATGCGKVATSIGEIFTSPLLFIPQIFVILLSLSGGFAILMLMYGGYRYMISRGDPEALKNAQQIIVSTVAGLLFLVFSFVILEVIAGDVLDLPGFS